MPVCIYCRARSETAFTKEHVVPEAFGHFQENLTLACVCGECNTLFNRNLEVFLTRDSVEALLRVRYGLKAKSGRRTLGRNRLTIRVISAGDWCGARMVAERNDRGDEVKVWPLPQVGFKKAGEDEREWFLESELDETSRWERYKVNSEAHIVGKPNVAVRRLADKLQMLGVVFKRQGEMENHRKFVQVFADSILDEPIFRCAAKIAFNFLAFSKGCDFALRSDFDSIRHYIRNGATAGPPFVLVSNNPILLGDSSRYRQTNGHLIIMDWNSTNDGIVCSLSLFNHLTYHISLCSNFSGLWHPLSDGRHFDLTTLTISTVRAINKSLLI